MKAVQTVRLRRRTFFHPMLLLVAALLPTTVVGWSSLTAHDTAVGVSRPVWDSPTPGFSRFEMHVTTLNPGAFSHPPHHHPWEEMLIVKEGSLDVNINGRHSTAPARSLIFFASNDVHNVRNDGPRPATYYVVNFHSRATETVRALPAAEWAPRSALRSGVYTWEEAAVLRQTPDVRLRFVDGPSLTFTRLEVHATTLPPGAAASQPHRHPWGALTILLSGSLDLSVEGTGHRMRAGDFAYLVPDTLQFQRNAGPEPASYLIVSVTTPEMAR